MYIRELRIDERPPMELLLLADPSLEAVERYISTGRCYIAELEGQVVGVYVLVPATPARPTVIELVNIAIDERFHRQGLGKRLLTHAVRTAGGQGYKTIEVGTGNSSIGQLAMYQKCGFRIVGVDADFFVRNYPEPIYENGIRCMDMIRLSRPLSETEMGNDD